MEKNQTWARKKYTDNLMYFPEGGWKVRVVNVDNSVVTYEVIEYEGKKVLPDNQFQKSIKEFLHMYEQN